MYPSLANRVLLLASFLFSTQAAVPISPLSNPKAPNPGSYIITYHSNITDSDIQTYHSTFLSRFSARHPSHGFTPLSLGSFHGFHAKLAPEVLEWVQESQHVVASIEPDAMVEANLPRLAKEDLWLTGRAPDADDGKDRGDGTGEEQEEFNDNILALLSYAGRPWNIPRISNRLGETDVYQLLVHPSLPRDLKLRVYVLDSGIRTTHEEFLDAVTGDTRAEWGVNYIEGGVNTDIDGHGTHVAGTVGGNTYGVENSTTLVSVKVIERGHGPVSGVISGIEWAYKDAKARNSSCIMNLSLGLEGKTCDGALLAIGRAARESGCLLVTSAGNGNTDASRNIPACSGDFLTVGAVKRTDQRPYWSNYGPAVDMFAPGVDVPSASHENDTGSKILSGTSMAAPHISGLAAYFSALLHVKNGDDLRNKILQVATVGAVDDGGTNSHNRLAYNGNCDSGTWGGYFCPMVKEELRGS